MSEIATLSGITEVYTRDVAARLMGLPLDRMGDVVVVSGRDAVIGRTPEYHDLKALNGGCDLTEVDTRRWCPW